MELLKILCEKPRIPNGLDADTLLRYENQEGVFGISFALEKKQTDANKAGSQSSNDERENFFNKFTYLHSANSNATCPGRPFQNDFGGGSFFALCEMSHFQLAAHLPSLRLRHDQSARFQYGIRIADCGVRGHVRAFKAATRRRTPKFPAREDARPTTVTAHPNASIQRHAAANVSRDVEVLAFVNCRFAFVKPPLGNNRQWQLCLEHFGPGFSRPATGLFG